MQQTNRSIPSWRAQSRLIICFVLFLLDVSGVGFSRDFSSTLAVPNVQDLFGNIAQKFQNYDVILKPDKDEAEWWAGAPSVVRDSKGVFWLACRMRTADSPRGLRGYEIRILRSEDGIHFKKAHRILREDVPIPGFERPALLIDPQTDRFKLYACGPWKQGPWSIIKFDDADDPTQFEPSSAKVVIAPRTKSYPRDVIVNEYKDPFHLRGIEQ